MQLRSGKEHSSGHGKAGLSQLLDELGARGPALVRGDSGYGNQDIIEICERHNRRYLLRLRKTANVKRLIERLFNRQDWTAANEASQGWQAIEDKVRLAGWSKERRVVVLRRRIKRDVALTRGGKEGQQQVLALGWDAVQEDGQARGRPSPSARRTRPCATSTICLRGGVLRKTDAGGRSTSYERNDLPE